MSTMKSIRNEILKDLEANDNEITMYKFYGMGSSLVVCV